MKLRIDFEPFNVGSAKWSASCPDLPYVTGLGDTKAKARAHLLIGAEEMLVERIARTTKLLAAVRSAKRKRAPVAKGKRR